LSAVIKKGVKYRTQLHTSLKIFLHGATAPSGPGPPPYHAFTITCWHTQ